MDRIVRFGVAMPQELLNKFDALILKKGYPNRSQALRDLVRESLVDEQCKSGNREAVGTATIIYSHDVKEISEVLNDLQHRYCRDIVSSLHIHLDRENCLEVLVLKGRVRRIKKISERMIATKGVKHGKLVISAAGKDI